MDWPQRLANFVQSRATTPFAWGQNDCCSFAADAVLMMTGSDPMRLLRGRYSTERGAMRLMKKAGGLGPLVSRYMGAPIESPVVASRGDVVLVPVSPARSGLGICVGADVAVVGEHGVLMINMTSALAAWRV